MNYYFNYNQYIVPATLEGIQPEIYKLKLILVYINNSESPPSVAGTINEFLLTLF